MMMYISFIVRLLCSHGHVYFLQQKSFIPRALATCKLDKTISSQKPQASDEIEKNLEALKFGFELNRSPFASCTPVFFFYYREGRYHQLYVKEFILHKLGEIYFNLMNAYFFMIQIEQGFKHT